jgi:hypothetical protein
MVKLLFHLYTLLQLLEPRINQRKLSLKIIHGLNTVSVTGCLVLLLSVHIPTLSPNFCVTCRVSDYLSVLHMLWDRVCAVSDLRELGALQNIQLYATYLQKV